MKRLQVQGGPALTWAGGEGAALVPLQPSATRARSRSQQGPVQREPWPRAFWERRGKTWSEGIPAKYLGIMLPSEDAEEGVSGCHSRRIRWFRGL